LDNPTPTPTPTATPTPTSTPSPSATPAPSGTPIFVPDPVNSVSDMGVSQSASLQFHWMRVLCWINSVFVSDAIAQTVIPPPTGETILSPPFELFDANSLRNALSAKVGISIYDQLVTAETNYKSAMTINPGVSIPGALLQTYQFKLNCALGPTLVVISAHDLLKSPQAGVICYNGNAYVGNTNLPAMNNFDVAIPFTEFVQQTRHKISANQVLIVGGGHQTSKKSNLKISILELNDALKTFSIYTISGLKNMVGETRIAKVVTPSLIQLIPSLDLNLVGKAMLVANLDGLKTITGFQLLPFSNFIPTDFSVACDASIAQKFQGRCPITVDPTHSIDNGVSY
jgi:hypothetical protein